MLTVVATSPLLRSSSRRSCTVGAPHFKSTSPLRSPTLTSRPPHHIPSARADPTAPNSTATTIHARMLVPMLPATGVRPGLLQRSHVRICRPSIPATILTPIADESSDGSYATLVAAGGALPDAGQGFAISHVRRLARAPEAH